MDLQDRENTNLPMYEQQLRNLRKQAIVIIFDLCYNRFARS